MVAALRLARAPLAVRAIARAAFSFASIPLGQVLARFDRRIAERGIALAAAAALDDLGATWVTEGTVPARGPLLVVANHPGAYDALVLFAALGRDDVAVLAADRTFLRALPELERRHLLLVQEQGNALSRFRGVRRAFRHLASGGALIHFGAGRIEPDPAFATSGDHTRCDPWPRGTGALVRGAARAGGVLAAGVVDGVHSARAKRLLVTRIAERYGLTTLAPLLQVAVPAYRDVRARVRFSDAIDASGLAASGNDAQITERVRSMTRRLLSGPPSA
jgi:hypothetical protein